VCESGNRKRPFLGFLRGDDWVENGKWPMMGNNLVFIYFTSGSLNEI